MRRAFAAVCLGAALLAGPAEALAQDKLAPGLAVFIRECSKCHQVGPGAKNRIGPQLNGLFGRKAGSVEDFKNYSEANRSAGFFWTPETLRAFLRDPRAMMAGTTQIYKGLTDDEQISALIEYLQTQ